jgi:ribonuclease HI
MKARLWTDGGARGNPGPAAYAYVLEAEDGTVLEAHGQAIGTATNNVAEYSALVAGLGRAAELGVSELEVRSESELMVKQMRGEYRVKNKDLQELFLAASRSERAIGRVAFTHVRREHNELAGRLVNEALVWELQLVALIEAAPLGGDPDGKIAFTVRGAAPAETFDVLEPTARRRHDRLVRPRDCSREPAFASAQAPTGYTRARGKSVAARPGRFLCRVLL